MHPKGYRSHTSCSICRSIASICDWSTVLSRQDCDTALSRFSGTFWLLFLFHVHASKCCQFFRQIVHFLGKIVWEKNFRQSFVGELPQVHALEPALHTWENDILGIG